METGRRDRFYQGSRLSRQMSRKQFEQCVGGGDRTHFRDQTCKRFSEHGSWAEYTAFLRADGRFCSVPLIQPLLSVGSVWLYERRNFPSKCCWSVPVFSAAVQSSRPDVNLTDKHRQLPSASPMMSSLHHLLSALKCDTTHKTCNTSNMGFLF